MDEAPRVAIITPTLGRRPDFLRQMIVSVKSQGVSVRHVVVAPNEAVGAGAFAAFAGLELVIDPELGLYGALNAGIRAIDNQEFLLFLNDDDLLRPRALGRLVDLLDNHPQAVFALGATEIIDREGEVIATFSRPDATVAMARWGPGTLFLPSCMFRASALQSVSLFDDSLHHAADLDLVIRLLSAGPAVTCKVPVSAFRWHTDSLTVRDRSASIAEAEAVRRRHLNGFAAVAYLMWRPVARTATVVAKRAMARRAHQVLQQD